MKLDARILVVDDDPSQREQLAGFLRDLGADVREAGDGARGRWSWCSPAARTW